MDNILNIEGRKTKIINPNTGYDLELRAIYQNTTYNFSMLNGLSPQAMIFQFSRENNQYVPDGLNIILLMTNGKGLYHSTGLVELNNEGKPKFYTLGNDLEIKVSPSADEAIRDLSKVLEIYPKN